MFQVSLAQERVIDYEESKVMAGDSQQEAQAVCNIGANLLQ